jgi:class 3 adenylate cyclase
MSVCAQCGQENPEVARFCLACGRPLADAGATTREERRIVSVIFVDLVEFTSRAESLDPEDVRAILEPYHDRVREEIESFGGVVEKFIGDAVVGVFGAPTAFGDDPERAVRAALAVRDALGSRVRVAVNTGEALVTLDARPEMGDAMVAGDVINTAARLQSAAPAGGVLVGAETYACTRDVFEYREQEPVVAKGKQLPVAVWLAMGASRRGDDHTHTPLVGRAGELEVLRGIWDRSSIGRTPHLVTVLGPPGVGKSRLVAEFLHLLGDDVRAVRGRCLPYRESSAYGAFAVQVKQLAGIWENDPPEVGLQKLLTAVERVGAPDPEQVAQHLGIILGLEHQASVDDRETLFFSVRCFIEAVAAERPIVLVFEDIHWADGVLLDMIDLLASRLHDLPILLLTLARPDLLDSRPGWGGGLPAYTSLPLQPLTGDDARALAMRLLDTLEQSRREEHAALFAKTGEGNPLFIEQLAAAAVERSSGSAGAIPTTIRGILAARLDALPAAERAVLLDAAVMGKVFWRGPVARVTDDPDSLPTSLGALERRDMISRETVSAIEGDQQYTFRHVLIRDVAYELLPRARRQELHAEMARYLEDEAPATGEAVTQMARHWREAGEGERAVGYFVLAAEEAQRGWAIERVIMLYKEALALVPEDDRNRRRELRGRMAVAYQLGYHEADVTMGSG